jgi:hypothetical protein
MYLPMARSRLGGQRWTVTTSFNQDEAKQIAVALTTTGETPYEFARVAVLERAERIAKKE